MAKNPNTILVDLGEELRKGVYEEHLYQKMQGNRDCSQASLIRDAVREYLKKRQGRRKPAGAEEWKERDPRHKGPVTVPAT